ncbi:hypothetical protein [Flindersiella endophytica]
MRVTLVRIGVPLQRRWLGAKLLRRPSHVTAQRGWHRRADGGMRAAAELPGGGSRWRTGGRPSRRQSVGGGGVCAAELPGGRVSGLQLATSGASPTVAHAACAREVAA